MILFDEEYEHWQQEEFTKACVRAGIRLYIPTDTELILDLDTTQQVMELSARVDRLNEVMGGSDNVVTLNDLNESTTQGHYHAYLTLRYPLDTIQRITCQMFLGSDPVKELLSMERHRAGIEPCTLLALGDWKSDLS